MEMGDRQAPTSMRTPISERQQFVEEPQRDKTVDIQLVKGSKG